MTSANTERLQSILRLSASATAPQVKVALSRLASELKVRSKGAAYSADYFVSALSALGRIKGTAHAELRMQCVKDCLFYFYTSGLIDEGLRATQQLESLAQASGNKSWTRVADTMSGIVYGDMGNVAEAVMHYARALSAAMALRDVDAEISVLVNLGSALNYGGLYQEALPCFIKAANVCDSGVGSHQAFKAAALSNLAQSFHSLGDLNSAFLAITEAIDLSRNPENAFDCYNRTVREFTFVRIALDQNEVASARRRLEQCQKYAIQCGSARAQFLADIANGLCEIRVGSSELGLTLLERAISSSVADAGPYRAEALKALVKAYDEAGRPEQALSCLRQLLAYIRSVREKSVQALFAQSIYPIRNPAPAEFADLHVLTCKEAELRAQVAERELADSQIEMLERLAITADLKDDASGQHGYRVGTLSRVLASKLGFPPDKCFQIELGARLHDIGKIAVPDRILLSTSTLAEAERHFVAAHTSIGAEILSKSNISRLSIAQEIACFHHEWWNGEGYPTQLSGERIPIHARIVALADVFDAITHGRPFAAPWPIEKAILEIDRRRGTQFDPVLAGVFIELIVEVGRRYGDLDVFLGKSLNDSPFLQARERIKKMVTSARQQEECADS